MSIETKPDTVEPTASRQPLPEVAKRALAEAEARRSELPAPRAKELNGRQGPDPVRYGDWEVKGLASDF